MAETITNITALPTYLEGPAAAYIAQLQKVTGGMKDADLSSMYGSQFVAGLDPLQQQAQALAQQGIGGYQKFLDAAAASTGPNAYKQFMSPYQQEVIDSTMADFDVQAQKGAQGIPAAAIAAGAFGGGREGVQRAEYQATSDRNRAGVQAQLRQQGFGQANQLAQQNMMNQLNLGQAQQGFLGQDVAGLSTLGGLNQAQNQAQLSAQQQLLQQQFMQPLSATQALGSGITSMIAGYPGGIQQQMSPTPSGLQTALSTGATLAGIYGAIRNRA